MNKVPFIFIVSVLILLQFEQINSHILTSIQNTICITLILTLGISHGAVDHLLYKAREKVGLKKFVQVYLIAIFVNTLIWIFSFDLALLLFLCTSAYHFGQSQFVEFTFSQKLATKVLNFAWGASIIVGIVLFNTSEIANAISQQSVPISLLTHLLQYGLYYFICFCGTTLVLMILKYAKRELNLQDFLLEIFQLALVFIAFEMFSTLIGFTLYFIILHSYRVLNQEFRYLWSAFNLKSIFHFVRLLLPFTILALIGMSVIFITWTYIDLNISLPLLAIILISNITLPHSFVMDEFYFSGHSIQSH